MNGRYVGYVAGDDPLHGFLSRIIRDLMGVREAQPAFRAFRLSGCPAATWSTPTRRSSAT